MLDFLKVIRYQNLIMLALMQLIFRYGFLKIQELPLALTDWQYSLLVLATVSIAAGGYLVNNIFDINTDLINKPKQVVIGESISEATAYNYYVVLNIIGVGCGFYLSNAIGKPGFSAIFIVIAATLYMYASNFKQTILIGNIIVALLLSVSVIIIGVYDLYPIITLDNQAILAVLFKILMDYAIFCFVLNFIREIVKDLADVKGDYNDNMHTLPIVLGVSRTARVVFFLSFIPLITLLVYINTYFVSSDLWYATIYGLVLVVGPLIYFTIKMWSAKTSDDFQHLSNVLKFVILFGILSIVVISLNIKYSVL